jgi:hypothetical protein
VVQPQVVQAGRRRQARQGPVAHRGVAEVERLQGGGGQGGQPKVGDLPAAAGAQPQRVNANSPQRKDGGVVQGAARQERVQQELRQVGGQGAEGVGREARERGGRGVQRGAEERAGVPAEVAPAGLEAAPGKLFARGRAPRGREVLIELAL